MARSTPPTRFEQLVRAHHAAVYRSALRVLRTPAEAEDAAQEVFLRVLDGRLAVGGGDAAEAQRVLCWWAIRVAWNTRRGEARRAMREEKHAMQRDDDADAIQGHEAHEHPAGERSVWGHVDQLPDELRVPLLLRFAEGLPFGRIGEALGVAESTAHERVGRALARLRQRLAHVGLGAFVPGLEERLVAHAAEVGAAAPPTGLAARLVALEASHAAAGIGLGSAAIGGLVCAALVVTGTVLWSVVTGPARADGIAALGNGRAALEQVRDPDRTLVADAGPDTRRALEVQPGIAPSTSGAPMQRMGDAALVQSHSGVVTGRVVDGDGAPLEDALVTVYSVERAGKTAAYAARTKSDADGQFSTAVEVANAEGGHYLVQVTRLGYTISTTEPTHVKSGATVDVGAVTAMALAGEVEGTFALELAVVDVHGAPVAGAGIELASVVDLPVEPGTQWSEWYARGDRLERIDARGVTDAAGVARLAGACAGAKLVRVQPRGTELAPLVERFDAAPGAVPRLVLVAEPGRTISGTIVDVDGGVPANVSRRVSVHVVVDLTGEWQHGEVAADGHFAVRGLPHGTHRVQLGPSFGFDLTPEGEAGPKLSPTWLDVEIAPDAAGSSGHEIALKLAADERDVGHHAAELHGKLIRGEDGAPLAVDCWALELDGVPDLDPVAYRRDWLPNHLFPRPVQRAMAGSPPPDSDRFHLTGLPAGRYVVRCTTGGRAALVHGPIELGEREVHAGLVLTAEPAGGAAGRVLDPDGRPLDGAFVLVTGIGPLSDEVIASGDREYRTADGRGYVHVNGTEERSKGGEFALGALPSGIEYRLVALHPKYAPAFGPTFTLTPGQARTGLEVRFTRSAESAR